MKFGALKRRLVSGVFFTGGAQVMRQLVQLGTIVVLARLLAPGAFGLVALGVAVLAFVQILADLGLATSSEREQDLTGDQESTLLRLSLMAALVLCVAVELGAPLLAGLFGAPDLTWVLRALAPPFLFAGALRTRYSALARGLRFRAMACVELVAVGAGAASSVLFALSGWGPAALVLGAAVQQLAWASATMMAAGLPIGRFDLKSVRPLLGFGGYMTAFNVVNFFTRKLDDFLVGGVMGMAALGLYEKSYALMMLPVTQLSAVIGRVMYPVLSRLKEDKERFRFLYLGAIRKIAGLSFPLAAVCIAQADPVVRLVLGPRFLEAIPIFAVLGLVMAFQPIAASAGWIFMARGKMGRFFSLGLVTGVVFCGAFVAGAWQGSVLAMAWWYAGTYAAMFFPTMLVSLRTAGIPFTEFLGRIAIPAVSAATAWLAAWTVPGAPLPVAVAVMAGAYTLVHSVLDRHAFIDLFRFMNPRRAFE